MRYLAIILAGLLIVGCGPKDSCAPAPVPQPAPGAVSNSAPVPVQPATVENPPGELAELALQHVISATVFITSRYRPCDKPADRATEADLPVTAWGSGFIVDESGLVITNRHVVEAWHMDTARSTLTGLPEARTLYHLHDVTVRLDSGTNKTRVYIAKVLAARELPDDLALLRIEPEKPLPALKLANSESLKMQQPLWAAGFPLGGSMEEALKSLKLNKNPFGPDISIREGRVTSLRRDDQGAVKGVENSCQVDHGNSGGPVVNAAGEVVAFTTYGIGDKSPLALPTERINHHFGGYLDKLRAARVSNGEARVLRVRKNPDPAKSGKTEFASPEQMLHDARDGDVCEIDAGEWVVDSLDWQVDKTIRIKGKGRDRTRLIVRNPVPIRAAPGHWLEISDIELTDRSPLDEGEFSNEKQQIARVLEGGHVYISNAKITRDYSSGVVQLSSFTSRLTTSGTHALTLEGTSSPDVCQCLVKGLLIRGPGSTPRLFGVDCLRSSIGSLRGSPICSGCSAIAFSADPWSDYRSGEPDPPACHAVLNGCWMDFIEFGVSVWGTSCRLEACRLYGLEASGQGSLSNAAIECVGCLFDLSYGFAQWRYCAIQIWRASASISDNLLLCGGYPAMRALENATGTADGNRITFDRVNIPLAMTPNQTRDELHESYFRTKCIGFELQDGSRMNYSRNHFSSSISGIAIALYGDAQDGGGDGNLCTGKLEYKIRK